MASQSSSIPFMSVPALVPVSTVSQCACGTTFSPWKKKIHCRNCGNVHCSQCISEEMFPLPKFGLFSPEKICMMCHTLIEMKRSDMTTLMRLSIKQLKLYIQAYSLQAEGIVEKQELARLILDTALTDAIESGFRQRSAQILAASSGARNFSLLFRKEPRAPPTPHDSPQMNDGPDTRASPKRDWFTWDGLDNFMDGIDNVMEQLNKGVSKLGTSSSSSGSSSARPESNPLGRMFNERGASARAPGEAPSSSGYPQPAGSSPRPNGTSTSGRASTATANPTPPDMSGRSTSTQPSAIPSISQIILDEIDVTSLSIKTLKAILVQNHVEVGSVIEKSDLVNGVYRLIDESLKTWAERGNGPRKQTPPAATPPHTPRPTPPPPSNRPATGASASSSFGQGAGPAPRPSFSFTPAPDSGGASSDRQVPRPSPRPSPPTAREPETPQPAYRRPAPMFSHAGSATASSSSASSSQLPTPPSMSSRSPSITPVIPPTVEDIVRDNMDYTKFSAKTLKAILYANKVDYSHVLEKDVLIKRVESLVNNYKLDMKAADNEDNLCKICCDAPVNCVILECGHLVTCIECARALERSTKECPICRSTITRVVHTFRS
ncbi:uncharacterized protein BJ171DRAFT_519726 [Polychytrium aggregatum]|uniref:uncharacterized protein n=1 Tax=Polychytrium aggregatum TaxID=110093 RepID=UPI0022FDCEAE|nr:uncharacterized protein BJ171DRAFT_519726 [Polychytrium aggregatum]KAI9197488.1 hypothetical protein BJ171DRAFT_519726 [Polychytrium aggregatum]